MQFPTPVQPNSFLYEKLPGHLTFSRPGWISCHTRYSIFNSFHLEISHCGASRARMSSKVGLSSTKVGWMLVRLEPNLAVKGLNRISLPRLRFRATPDVHLFNPFTARLNFMTNIIMILNSFPLEISNCDATRARIELESHHSY